MDECRLQRLRHTLESMVKSIKSKISDVHFITTKNRTTSIYGRDQNNGSERNSHHDQTERKGNTRDGETRKDRETRREKIKQAKRMKFQLQDDVEYNSIQIVPKFIISRIHKT